MDEIRQESGGEADLLCCIMSLCNSRIADFKKLKDIIDGSVCDG